MSYAVYIIECDDGSYYIGHSSDEILRFQRHKGKTGAEYTKIHKPKKIVYSEQFDGRTEAVQRELQLKKWSRAKKIALINGDIQRLKKLSVSHDHKTK